MPQLKVYKEDSELLFDTALICYGLVKSGYMTYLQTWSRRQLLSAQLDPNNGANWSPVAVTVNPAHQTDSVYGFTVTNAASPIVFITGPGCFNGSYRTGNSITYYYSNATTATKYYCFDLMQDNISGSPYLKTFTPTNVITFNSLQPPLNVVATVQAPGPGSVADLGYVTCYNGGYNYNLNRASDQYNLARLVSRVDISLAAGVEYAAYLPWSRSVGIYDLITSGDAVLYGGVEGAFGGVGNMSFIFGASAGTTHSYPLVGPGTGGPSYTQFSNLPTDRYPVALIIKTANLPFPYN